MIEKDALSREGERARDSYECEHRENEREEERRDKRVN